jgi:hypothetical protein
MGNVKPMGTDKRLTQRRGDAKAQGVLKESFATLRLGVSALGFVLFDVEG